MSTENWTLGRIYQTPLGVFEARLTDIGDRLTGETRLVASKGLNGEPGPWIGPYYWDVTGYPQWLGHYEFQLFGLKR